MREILSKYFIGSICIVFFFSACVTTKHKVVAEKGKRQIAEYSVDWLKYKLYLMPEEAVEGEKKTKANRNTLKLSLMIINMKDNFSPLRKLCSDINQYNVYNEYLLNSAKNEIYIVKGTGINYPVYYSFENNYNAFPFETINVGYVFPPTRGKNDRIDLVFVDRIFSKDTITFNLNSSLK